MGTATIQPLDMVKVRIQLGAAEGGSTNPMEIARKMLRHEGVASFYSGLSAGLMRQVIYTGSRLGLYDVLTEAAGAGRGPLPFWKVTLCSLTAGGAAAVIGNPADLALVRMQADTMLPMAERRNYRNVFHALSSIQQAEGTAGLFKGTGPTVARAMSVNFGMLGFNTMAKDQLAVMGAAPGGAVHVLGGAAIAGFFAAFFCLPFDYVKTQVQKMKADPVTGQMPYKGPIDCALQQVRMGGPQRLWSGFPVFYFRIAPHVMITLVVQDRLKTFWTSMGM